MNILMCFDDMFIDYSLVALYSLMKNNDVEMTIYIFHTDRLSKKNIKKIEKLVNKFGNQIKTIGFDAEEIWDLPVRGWPIEAWFRHFVVSRIPQDVKYILYLDGDIVVNDDIVSFYNMEMKDKCYVAAMDRPLNGCCDGKRDEQRFIKLGMTAKDIYVNSGVLLINLEQIREQGYKQEDYWKYARLQQENLQYPDQDVLNGMFSGKILLCDESIYNCQINTYSFEDACQYIEKAKIIHYTSYRPWDLGYKRVKAGMIWWRYATRVGVVYWWKYIVWMLSVLGGVLPWHMARIVKKKICEMIRREKNN